MVKVFFLNGDIGFQKKPLPPCGCNPSKCFVCLFLPMPLEVAWVNRWTFSSSPPSPLSPSTHHQLFVSLRYKKFHGGEAWVLCCDAILF